MTGLRVTLGAIGIAAIFAGAALGRPEVFFPLLLLGLAAFVISVGCLAADLLPLHPRHAIYSSASLLVAVVLALGARQAAAMEIVPGALLVLLQAAPAARSRHLRAGS